MPNTSDLTRPISKPWLLIDTFASVWQREYGEVYEKSPKDFVLAKRYLEISGGDFVPDNIIAKAQVYLRMDGVYAEQNVRHNFSCFINNISTFTPPKGKPIKFWTCPQCQASMPEGKQYSHPEQCPNWNKQSPEEINSMVNSLTNKMRFK